ncbi:hypothetical protein RIF29_25615 [Crotalaria pallida]|uniref:Uncharacterized protein n=1 Tax=Crotalaria pallida TaxID=3830 RepID=A0AAN9EP23_CROPI
MPVAPSILLVAVETVVVADSGSGSGSGSSGVSSSRGDGGSSSGGSGNDSRNSGSSLNSSPIIEAETSIQPNTSIYTESVYTSYTYTLLYTSYSPRELVSSYFQRASSTLLYEPFNNSKITILQPKEGDYCIQPTMKVHQPTKLAAPLQ